MRLKPVPFVIATGAGTALHFIVTLVSTVATYFLMMPLLSDPAQTLDGDQTLLLLASALSELVCLCTLILDVVVGVSYSLTARHSDEVDIGDGAIGGLVSAVIARLISGLFISAISAALSGMMLNQVSPAELNDPALGIFMVANGMAEALIKTCISAVAGGVLGAIGGGVAAALVGQGRA